MEMPAGLAHAELRGVTREQRRDALRAARRTPFDELELVGLAVAAIVTALFLRYAVPEVRGWTATLRTLVALPVLAVTSGPFLLRRTRRGLRRALGLPA